MPIVPRPCVPGERSGHWTVLSEAPKRPYSGARFFLCRCDCGKEGEINSSRFWAGKAQSCGCQSQPGKIPIGARFGRWTVIGHRITDPGKRAGYPCRCDCGAERIVTTGQLRSGRTRSCGCLRSETTIRRSTKHGAATRQMMEAGSRDWRLYGVWSRMRQRCHNPNNSDFEHYGGRGIFVCAEWREDFAPFKKWAEANGYQEDLEIDRRDNNGPYSPANCRFVTHQANCQNRRRPRRRKKV